MPLQFAQAEEPEHSFSASTRAETVSPAAPLAGETPRYDVPTVQQILVSAQEMQARHRETLTPGDIQALGQEIGSEPEFVARALAQMEGHGKTTQAVSTGPRGTGQRHRRADWLPIILYLLSGPLIIKGLQIFAPTLPHETHHRHPTASSSPFTLGLGLCLGFYLVLPGILAFLAGYRQKSKERGAGAGAWYGLASLLAFGGSVVYAAATEVHEPGWSGMTVSGTAFYVGVVFLLLLGTWLGYGALLGLGGASIGQAINRRRKRRGQAMTKIRGKQDGEWV